MKVRRRRSTNTLAGVAALWHEHAALGRWPAIKLPGHKPWPPVHFVGVRNRRTA